MIGRLVARLTGWTVDLEARMNKVEASSARVERGLTDLNDHLKRLLVVESVD